MESTCRSVIPFVEDMFQISSLKKTAVYLLTLQLLLHATPAFCDGRFYVIWRDIGLPDAVRLVSQYSGRTILLDHEVHGTINLASATPLSPDEIFTLFQKSLQERGLVLVRVDDNGYQVKTAESDLASMAVASTKRGYIGAIFASEQRARSIVSRLNAAGAEAEVIASGSPADKDFSIVLLYRDNAESYQAMVVAIQRAGLNSLISTPTLSLAAPIQSE